MRIKTFIIIFILSIAYSCNSHESAFADKQKMDTNDEMDSTYLAYEAFLPVIIKGKVDTNANKIGLILYLNDLELEKMQRFNFNNGNEDTISNWNHIVVDFSEKASNIRGREKWTKEFHGKTVTLKGLLSWNRGLNGRKFKIPMQGTQKDYPKLYNAEVISIGK